MIDATGLTLTYPGAGSPALRDVDLSVPQGRVVAVIGHNGAGKTTLFDLLAGVRRPDAGRVTRAVGSDEIGWCPQREIIDWSLTVRQNIAMGVELRTGSSRGLRRAVAEVVDVMGLTGFADRQAETLSGGELRRTQIARALVGSPRLLILDEPTNGLDPDGVERVFAHIRAAAAAGATALVSTHDTSRFAGYCDSVIALRNGRVVFSGPLAGFMGEAGGDDLWTAYLRLPAGADR